jgi:helicase
MSETSPVTICLGMRNSNPIMLSCDGASVIMPDEILIIDLRNFGVPQMVIDNLPKKYEKLLGVQAQAVRSGLFDRRNLLVCAPTSSGKTFIGELAAIVASRKLGNQRVFYLVPAKSLAEEKYVEFESKYGSWGLHSAISTSERSEFDDRLLDFDIIIATYEKLYALLIRDKSLLGQIGVVIIDEIQNIGDESRGPTLEILITFLIHLSKSNGPQVIALSATVPNPEDLGTWLNATLVVNKNRTVELREGIQYVGDVKFDFKSKVIEKGTYLFKEYNSEAVKSSTEPDMNLVSTYANIAKTEQVLIFAQRKKGAEELALLLSKIIDVGKNIGKWIEELDSRLETTPSTASLRTCFLKGIAFHHADLLYEEKNLVERAFEEGSVRVIVSTSTLSTGINTPAKTVIILDNNYLKVGPYKNMAGRAGRISHHDDFGRSILIARSPKQFEAYWDSFIEAIPERIITQIPKANLDIEILGLVSAGIVSTLQQLLDFLRSTFFGHNYYQTSNPEFRSSFDKELANRVELLREQQFIKKEGDLLFCTELGKCCANELLSPKTMELLFASLKKLESRPDLVSGERLVGVLVRTACQAAWNEDKGLLVPFSYGERDQLFAKYSSHKDDYLIIPGDADLLFGIEKTSEMLLQWIDGNEYNHLKKYAEPGQIRKIASAACWILGGMVQLVEHNLVTLDKSFPKLAKTLSRRLTYGIPENGIELSRLRISCIGRVRTKILCDAGYTSLTALMEASVKDLEQLKEFSTSLAVEIKKSIENKIKDEMVRSWHNQTRRAKAIARDSGIIDALYTKTGDEFSLACYTGLKTGIGIDCVHVGPSSIHDVDIIVNENNEKIVIDCKRKNNGEAVPSIEAEEVLGKGKRHSPKAYVTIGYPKISKNAIVNIANTNITMLTLPKFAEMIVSCWEEKVSKEDILRLLKSGTYNGSIEPEPSLQN